MGNTREEAKVLLPPGFKNCCVEDCSQVNPQPISQFYRCAARPDGHHSRCKSCFGVPGLRSKRRKREEAIREKNRELVLQARKICVREACFFKDLPQPISEFYEDKSRSTGRAPWCVTCYNEKGRDDHAQNLEARNQRIKEYRAQPDKKEYLRAYAREYYHRPEVKFKWKARSAVNTAIRSMDLLPPTTYSCMDCGNPAKEYDHYRGHTPEHWFDIQPVCTRCHKQREKVRNDAARQIRLESKRKELRKF